MTRVFVIPAADFDLPKALREATALNCEDTDEDTEGVEHDSECCESESPEAPAESGHAGPARGEALCGAAQSAKNRRRAATRLRKKALQGRQIRAPAALKHMLDHPLLTTKVEYVQLPAASCGYQAVNEQIKWDGVTSQVVVEGKTGKIMVTMAGQPNDPTYKACQLRATNKILVVGEAAEFTVEELDHKRASNSAALNHGIFHGVGTSGPVNLSNGRRTQLLKDLVKDPDVCRMASFADEVYEEVEAKLDQLYNHDPSLLPPFECCVLPCAAFNFGPQVCCKGHRDPSNLPHSWCAITALGQFDSEQGGHLVIEELRIFIQFPPGATILIPSALLTHGNTPVGQGEVRLSFTVFCPGGLLRWVDNGFQTQDSLRKRVNKKEFKERMSLKEVRWQEGMAKICTLQQLVDRYTPKTEDAGNVDLGAPGFTGDAPSA
ncbi:hypothetical protein EST38_g10034 [Candolleomyces aberdarensis]|uniref:Uncharacterized protein n=1 Tax=Candolleomyces aberdarensis TaxID=2316362 RepID=A0A4Q2D8F8_9AGAR|nr:hypothetical protein EST38_g10034 [Candolleomyces aberdarensis]